MILIEPSVEVLVQEKGINGINQIIEQAGRTCYKSDHLIKEGSAEKFVKRMMDSNHGAMLEHGTVYLFVKNYGDSMDDYDQVNFEQKYVENPYSFVNFGPRPNYNSWEEKQTVFRGVYITTNMRVLFENGWLDDLRYGCEPTEYHTKRHSIRIIMDRIGSQSFVRHRVMSFGQESTRYCSYDKDKFGGEISISVPIWLMDRKELEAVNTLDLLDLFRSCYEFPEDSSDIDYWELANRTCEFCYMNLIKKGWVAEQAREVLPADLKTELVMTATKAQWEAFFDLRIDKHAHPNAQHCAQLIKDALGLWK